MRRSTQLAICLAFCFAIASAGNFPLAVTQSSPLGLGTPCKPGVNCHGPVRVQFESANCDPAAKRTYFEVFGKAVRLECQNHAETPWYWSSSPYNPDPSNRYIMVIKFGIANSLPGCTGWASEAITEQVGLCRSEGFNHSSIYLFKAEEPIVFQRPIGPLSNEPVLDLKTMKDCSSEEECPGLARVSTYSDSYCQNRVSSKMLTPTKTTLGQPIAWEQCYHYPSSPVSFNVDYNCFNGKFTTTQYLTGCADHHHVSSVSYTSKNCIIGGNNVWYRFHCDEP